MAKGKMNLSETISILHRAFKISFSIKSKASKFISLLGILVAFFPALISKTIEQFSNEVQMLYETAGSNIYSAITWLIFLVLLYILQITYQTTFAYFSKIDTLRVTAYIKTHIIDSICSVKYKYINNVDQYMEKVQFAETVAGDKVASSIQSVSSWVQYSITFLSIAIVLYRLNPLIVGIILITIVPAAILAYKQSEETFLSSTRWTKEGHWLIHNFSEMIDHRNLPEIHYLSIMDYLETQRKENADNFITKKKELTKKHVIYNSIADILRSGVYILIMLVVVNAIFTTPAIGIGSFMLAFSLTSQFQDVSAAFLTSILSFFNDIKYMQEFFSLELYEKDLGAEKQQEINSTEICFENVIFRYPGTVKNALDNINIKIKAGEKVAIVGENGSGKTTFVNLLCGFFSPQQGTVTIGGNNVAESTGIARKYISSLFQDYSKYETTIRDNIVLDNSTLNNKDIIDICRKVGLFNSANISETKLTEAIGVFDESGKNLSGGQWQKIAIARMLCKLNAKIMILDEPTSALDPKAECEIYQHLPQIMADRTTILITHRLGAIKLVDRILVFQEGRIVEEGNHENLMKLDGVYAEMYRAQAHWYE